MINQKIIELCAKEHDSFYMYDEHTILDSINTLKSNFPQIEFLYSIKCNPNTHVLKSICSQHLGADAASAAEVKLARNAGVPANHIFYSAPGKSIEDIKDTMNDAMIIVDSLNELKRIQMIAESSDRVIEIGIRINPNFSFDGTCGQASKFGIDEDQALEYVRHPSCKNVKIIGIHIHLKSQVLNAESLAAYYKNIVQLAERFIHILGPLAYVNMGSGMGITYASTDLALDMAALSQSIQKSLDGFHCTYPNTRLMIEVGRYVVCKSGIYVTRVMDRKESYGKTYLILKNTLNGFIRPSLAMLVGRYCSEEFPVGAEPLFTCKNAFDFVALKETNTLEKVTLVGNLCTATDVIANDVLLPKLDCGDLIVMTNAGSYAAVLSPMQFSSQEIPQEFFVTETGSILSLCRKSGST